MIDVIVKIDQMIAEAEECAKDPEAGQRDLDCFFMASGVLADLRDWVERERNRDQHARSAQETTEMLLIERGDE